MVTVEGLREYVREVPESDNELQLYLNAGLLYAENAGVGRTENNELYALLIYMLASHWYNNRGLVRPSAMNEIPLGATALINQLRG